ncbi:MAG: phospholipase [Archangiaceae bacterium]|nr:phospholipase [Archangiaceae bacterium]
MRSVIAGLDVVTVQHKPQVPPDGVVVLCHGFGAPGTDLVGLAEALVAIEPSLAAVRFVFPAAPLDLANLGYGHSRAWWMIDFDVIAQLRTASPEALREFRKNEPEGMPAARKAVHALVGEVMNASRLPYSKLVLGGFSQGAMISTDVALRLEEAPAGLAVLSGTLLTEDVWRKKATARAGLPVFQSHGRVDAVLPFTAARWLEQLLVEAGLAVDFTEFEGGHEIPLEVLHRLAAFLNQTLKLR